MRRSGISVLAVVVVLAGSTNAAPRDKAISNCMASAASAFGFSGTVYASNNDHAVERSFGSSDADGDVANGSHTRFNIGSIDKTFTAVAIGILVDRGVVRFDAPIGLYLSGLVPEFGRITVAELLDHTSGLGDYFRPENRAAIDAAKTATDLLPLALSSPPAFAPGSKRAYSNSGYIVLGAIIEKVSGLTWAEFVRREMLDPAGMSDTRVDSVGGAVPLSRMSPTGRLDKPRAAPGPILASPAGGLFSTPRDLSRFLSALFGGRIVSKTTLAQLTMSRADPAGGPQPAGYGFVIHEKAPAKISVGGGAPGVNADIAYFPDSGWQLIALANIDPPAATLMDRVLERVVTAPDPAAACSTALADPTSRTSPTMLIGPAAQPSETKPRQ